MSSPLSHAEQVSLNEAAGHLSQGNLDRAVALADGLIAANPAAAEAFMIRGAALHRLGRLAEAEAALRQAVRLDPGHSASAVALSDLLLRTDRALLAREVLAPHVARQDASIFVLTADGAALKSLRRFPEAAKAYERARDNTPGSAVAEHNLAGVYGDMSRYADAERSTARAFAKGLDAPETWLVRARALQGLRRLDEAEQAFREAIRRRPAYAEAHGDLAQLLWMRTGDAAGSTSLLDAAVLARSNDVGLWLKKIQFLEYVAGPREAYEALTRAPAEVRASVEAEAAAAQLACWFDPQLAIDHANRALAPSADSALGQFALCQAELAMGDAEAAARTAGRLRARWSLNQHVIAMQATAWRMMGNAAYKGLYDYQTFVRGYQIDTPAGWGSLDAYVADLAEALERSHAYRAHPIGQSLRQGSQSELTPNDSGEPAIAALPQALDGPIRRYLADLGPGSDPLRSRITGDYATIGMWSARLRPGGFHTNHVHQMGWISSACHVVTPASLGQNQEGWLTFGEPGFPTRPPLAAEHFVRPEAGTVVLFPSYMWHGTIPFSGEDRRLSLAYDLLPA